MGIALSIVSLRIHSNDVVDDIDIFVQRCKACQKGQSISRIYSLYYSWGARYDISPQKQHWLYFIRLNERLRKERMLLQSVIDDCLQAESNFLTICPLMVCLGMQAHPSRLLPFLPRRLSPPSSSCASAPPPPSSVFVGIHRHAVKCVHSSDVGGWFAHPAAAVNISRQQLRQC